AEGAGKAPRERPRLLPDGQRPFPHHRAGPRGAREAADQRARAAELPSGRVPPGRPGAGGRVGQPVPVRDAGHEQRRELRPLVARRGRAAGRHGHRRRHRQLGGARKGRLMRSAPRGQRRRSACTLIELFAVLLIMGLVAGLTLPNLSLRSERVVLGEAQQLAADLAFTRRRAVATGTPHRVVVDLDNAGWWIEAWPEEAGPFAPVAVAADG